MLLWLGEWNNGGCDWKNLKIICEVDGQGLSPTGVNIINLFYSITTAEQNKLEYFSLASLYSLALFLCVRPRAKPIEWRQSLT